MPEITQLVYLNNAQYARHENISSGSVVNIAGHACTLTFESDGVVASCDLYSIKFPWNSIVHWPYDGSATSYQFHKYTHN